MNKKELEEEILPCFERIVRFSLLNGLNVHSSVGGKYGELFVANELWAHGPKLGTERSLSKTVRNPKSCDILLEKTGKKLEVKWAMLHDGDFYTARTDGIPFWGWGFGENGNQFEQKKFDYCVLLASGKNDARPKHIFVIRCDEMTKSSMGGQRPSGVWNKGSVYIEFSENGDYYKKRKWYPRGMSEVEKSISEERSRHKQKWMNLKRDGKLNG